MEEIIKRQELERKLSKERKRIEGLEQLIKESGIGKRMRLFAEFKALQNNEAEIHCHKFCEIFYLSVSTVFIASTAISTGALKGKVVKIKLNTIIGILLDFMENLSQSIPVAGPGISFCISLIKTIFKEFIATKNSQNAKKISEILWGRFSIPLEEHVNLLALDIAIRVTENIKNSLEKYKKILLQKMEKMSFLNSEKKWQNSN